jgi:2-phospho-L-lactate guanylyltransferase
MKYLLIPVKELSNAKQRLAGLMSQDERTRLASLMLRHVFSEVAHASGYHRAAVVTLYGPAIELGRSLGFEIIEETEQISESVSVDYGSRSARESGAHSALRLPIDLPLVLAEDIETVLSNLDDQPGKPMAVLVPSRDRTGTNALGRTPPELFPSHFGPGSFDLHRADAQRCGAICRELHLPRIECDIDDPADVAYLLEHGRGSTAHEYLMDLGIQNRLRGIADCGLRIAD